MRITAMSSRRSVNTRATELSWKKNLYGQYSFKQLEAWRHCTTWKFFIVTWRVRIYFCIKTLLPNLAIWTSRKLQKRAFYILKRAPLITPVLKFGRINHMIRKAIFGPLAVYSMKCAHLSHLSVQTTWMASSNEFWKDNSHRYPRTTLSISDQWSRPFWV